MDELTTQVWAVDALGALAHETRLSVVMQKVVGVENFDTLLLGNTPENVCP